MKVNSNLGKVCAILTSLAQKKGVLDDDERKSARVRIDACSEVIKAVAIDENIELQYARIAERKSRIPKL